MGYAYQLLKRWGLAAPRQFYRMLKLHNTPFSTILGNIFGALDHYSAKFAFPVVAAVASMRPELIHDIIDEGHEIASHGYNHIRYTTLSEVGRERDLRASLTVLRGMGVTVNGFRAPYDNYTDDMPSILHRLGMAWDGGLGYRPEHRGSRRFFHQDLGGTESVTTFIPLNVWSDDLMIDRMNMQPEQITKRLLMEVDKAAEQGGVLMFDLHPIRIGQSKYVGCLAALVEHASTLGAWIPTPTEAVKHWKEHGKWKGDSTFCLLLTGDIDNWVFADYLRRQIWRSRLLNTA